METRQKYNYTFGVLSALGILFVVAGHLGSDILTVNNLYPYYSFHMGLFMFISGYFYKSKNENSIKAFFLKKIKTLIIPYFLWNFFYGILVSILHTYGFKIGQKLNLYTLFVQPFIDGHQFYFNLASWFLIALFIVQIVYILTRALVSKFINNESILLLLLLLIFNMLGIISIKISLYGYNYSYWLILIRTLFFLPFYCIGNIYKERLEKYDKLNNYLYFAIIMGMQLIIILHYGWIPTFSAVFGQFFENPYMQYLVAILGILFWLRIARIVTPIVKEDGYIIYIGKHSFSIMMHHIGVIYFLMLLIVLINKTS